MLKNNLQTKFNKTQAKSKIRKIHKISNKLSKMFIKSKKSLKYFNNNFKKKLLNKNAIFLVLLNEEISF